MNNDEGSVEAHDQQITSPQEVVEEAQTPSKQNSPNKNIESQEAPLTENNDNEGLESRQDTEKKSEAGIEDVGKVYADEEGELEEL